MRGPLAAINLVSHEFGVGVHAILANRRGGERAALARQVAEYQCSIGLNLSPTRVAAIFGRHRASVEHALRTLEDSRADGSAFDLWLDALTDRLVARTSLESRQRETPPACARDRLPRGAPAAA